MPLGILSKTRIVGDGLWGREIGVDENGRVYHECDNSEVHPPIAEFVRNYLAPCEACELIVTYRYQEEVTVYPEGTDHVWFKQRRRMYLDLGNKVQLNFPEALAELVWRHYGIEHEQGLIRIMEARDA